MSHVQKFLDDIPKTPLNNIRRELDLLPDPHEAHRRRGAHWTFDGRRFLRELRDARRTGGGRFPGFDHARGDPVENQWQVGVTKFRRTDPVDAKGPQHILQYLALSSWCHLVVNRSSVGRQSGTGRGAGRIENCGRRSLSFLNSWRIRHAFSPALTSHGQNFDKERPAVSFISLLLFLLMSRVGEQVEQSHAVVIVEGNYLLLKGVDPWDEASGLFDEAWAIRCPPEVCGERYLRNVWRVSVLQQM